MRETGRGRIVPSSPRQVMMPRRLGVVVGLLVAVLGQRVASSEENCDTDTGFHPPVPPAGKESIIVLHIDILPFLLRPSSLLIFHYHCQSRLYFSHSYREEIYVLIFFEGALARSLLQTVNL